MGDSCKIIVGNAVRPPAQPLPLRPNSRESSPYPLRNARAFKLSDGTEDIADDSVGKLAANMLAAIAQFDNDAKSERTIAGMKAAVELGRWPFQAPLGYVNGREGAKGCLVRDPQRAPLVRQAFELFATGRFTKTEVLRRVNALGLVTQRGKTLGPDPIRWTG